LQQKETETKNMQERNVFIWRSFSKAERQMIINKPTENIVLKC